MPKLKENIGKVYLITNKLLYTNKAKRKCRFCYFQGLAMGLPCHWIQKGDGLCRQILKEDIKLMTEE